MAKRKKKAKSGVESPTSDCVLLCDDIVQSVLKGKHTLVGVIGGVRADGFPAAVGPCVAYVRFSNVYRGGQTIVLRFSDADSEQAIIETEAIFPTETDPLGVYTIVVPVPVFQVPKPGRYLFGAYHNDLPISVSVIQVIGPPEET